MKKYKNEEKLEMFHKDGMMPLILVCLISADNLIDVDSCEKALAEMKRYKEALPNANIEEGGKKKDEELMNQGLEIIERDLNQFKMETDG